MANILIISPHPDDFIFFMGGTFLKHAHSGDEVRVVLLTLGEQGEWWKKRNSKSNLSQRRLSEAQKSIADLTTVKMIVLSGQDQKLREDPEWVAQLNGKLEGFKPEVVYYPENKSEYSQFQHPDHLASGTACAAWLRTKDWAPAHRQYHSKKINERIDVSPYTRECFSKLRLHRSQYSFFSNPPFLLVFGEILKKIALYTEGKKIGVRAAEGFRRS